MQRQRRVVAASGVAALLEREQQRATAADRVMDTALHDLQVIAAPKLPFVRLPHLQCRLEYRAWYGQSKQERLHVHSSLWRTGAAHQAVLNFSSLLVKCSTMMAWHNSVGKRRNT